MQRRDISEATKRLVLVEAGHRCAIPTCRQTTTEIAHIIPWAKTQDDSSSNLIALCPTCHTRYDQKKEIDLKSMQMYKQNLLNSGIRPDLNGVAMTAVPWGIHPVFIIDRGIRRGITSDQIFLRLFGSLPNRNNVIEYIDINKITSAESFYEEAELVQACDATSPVFLVDRIDSQIVKREITSAVIFNLYRFSSIQIRRKPTAFLSTLPSGPDIEGR